MKKMVLLLLVFFVAACTPNSTTPDELASVTSFVRSGTQGLDVSFVKNLPPARLYAEGGVVLVSEIRNLGSHDVKSEDCVLHLSGYSDSIVRGITNRQNCGDLPGKSVLNVDGGFNQVEYSSSSLVLPEGVSPYVPNFVATACYKYQTVAAPQVCIDPGFVRVSSAQKACLVRDVSLAGGQGAPVSVSFVNVDMVRDTAVFTFDIVNNGGGRVISPRVSLSQCPANLKYADFDTLSYAVDLPGASLVGCSPQDLVRLSNNQGRLVCRFKVPHGDAYESPVRVELNYNYMQSASRPVEILAFPE